MVHNRRKLYIAITAICFVMFGLWYAYKKNETEISVFTPEPPAPAATLAAEPPEPETVYYKVHVTGEVNAPGVYTLEAGSRVEDAVNAAGGLTENAYDRSVNLAAKVFDEQQIIVYNKEETETPAGTSPENLKININTATVSELTKLGGIGEVTANNIIKYRESNGGFSSVDELKNVSRIGDKLFDSIKDEITVE